MMLDLHASAATAPNCMPYGKFTCDLFFAIAILHQAHRKFKSRCGKLVVQKQNRQATSILSRDKARDKVRIKGPVLQQSCGELKGLQSDIPSNITTF